MIDHPDNTGKSYRAIARLRWIAGNCPANENVGTHNVSCLLCSITGFLSALVGKVPGVWVQVVGHTMIILAMRLFHPG